MCVYTIACHVYVCTVKPLYSNTQWGLRIYMRVGLGGCWIMEYLLPYYILMYGDCTSYYNGRIRENVGL